MYDLSSCFCSSTGIICILTINISIVCILTIIDSVWRKF